MNKVIFLIRKHRNLTISSLKKEGIRPLFSYSFTIVSMIFSIKNTGSFKFIDCLCVKCFTTLFLFIADFTRTGNIIMNHFPRCACQANQDRNNTDDTKQIRCHFHNIYTCRNGYHLTQITGAIRNISLNQHNTDCLSFDNCPKIHIASII